MNEHERAELARLLPPPARPELSSDRHRLLRGHLMSEIRDTKPARVRRGKLGWVAIPALAGGLALAMVLPGGSDGAASKAPLAQQQSGQQVQGEQPAENGSTTLNVAPVAAVQLLTQAADTAAGKPDPKPGKNQFVYVDSLVSFAGTNANGETHVDKVHRRQIWLSVDGSQRGLLKEEGKFGKGEAAAKEGDKRPAPSPDGGLWLDPTKKPSIGAPTYNYLAGLPTDPDALLKKIYAETKGQGRTLTRRRSRPSGTCCASRSPRRPSAPPSTAPPPRSPASPRSRTRWTPRAATVSPWRTWTAASAPSGSSSRRPTSSSASARSSSPKATSASRAR